MLTRFHKILLAALAVQLALVAFVLTRDDDAAALRERPILAGFDADKVTRLQVFAAGPTAKPVDLVKRDAGWVVGSAFDYPVDKTKVTDAVSPIAKAAAAAPIATQAGRHKQLRVAADDFERKLVITSGGKDTTLYLGSAAGARRIAVRIDGDDRVYAVSGLSAFAFGTEPRQWVDTGYVKVPRDDVTRLVVARDGKVVELARPAPPAAPADGSGSAAGSAVPPAAGPWTATIAGAPLAFAAGESLDDAAVDRLLGQVATIDLTTPADPKRDAAKPTATITIERKPSGATTPAPIVVDVIADGTSYWVRDRSSPHAILVDKARLDDVLAIDRDKLVKKPPPPATPTPGVGSAAPRPGPGAAVPAPAVPAPAVPAPAR
jgi:hypothetical protein